MSAYAGPAGWWTSGTDAGRTHIATKGVVQSGLVLNLDAGVLSSYPASGNTWIDLSGTNNTGTLINSPTFDSGSGGSLVFNGSNNYVNVPISTSLQITQNITVSMWIYNKVWKNSDIIEGGITAFNNAGIMLWTRTSDNKIKWGRQYTTGALQLLSSTNFSTVLNVWYNIVGTYDGTTLKLYYNGVLDNSLVSSITFNNTSLTIGAGIAASSDGYFNGNIADVKIYNRELSADEILKNFNAMRDRFGV